MQGNTQKRWKTIDGREKHLLAAHTYTQKRQTGPRGWCAEVRNVVTGQASIEDTHAAVLFAVGMFEVVIFCSAAYGALVIPVVPVSRECLP